MSPERWTGPEGTYHHDSYEVNFSQEHLQQEQDFAAERKALQAIVDGQHSITAKDVPTVQAALERLGDWLGQEKLKGHAGNQTAIQGMERLRERVLKVLETVSMEEYRDSLSQKPGIASRLAKLARKLRN